MSRVKELRDRLKAELAVAELEDELVAAKADPNYDPAALRDLKGRLRQARHDFRVQRAGDGAAAAETVRTKATVED